MTNKFLINMDAFSDGQVASKLWLCNALEKCFDPDTELQNVWIYGSWYGLLPFLILAKSKLKIKNLHLFDIDEDAIKISQKILDHWKFVEGIHIHFHVHDCQHLIPELSHPDLVINTSVEHFPDFQWWNNISDNTYYALQSTDMKHVEHINCVESLLDFKEKLNLKSPPILEDKKDFDYTSFQFSRFMLIGKKS